MNKIRESIEKNIKYWYFATIVVIIGTIVAFAVLMANERVKNAFRFNEHLEDIACTVDGVDIPLKEAAYYILVIESNINEDAKKYDENFPIKYWNLYLNDGDKKSNFLRTQAKEDTIKAIVRDGIYYNLALEEGISLNKSEISDCIEDTDEQYKALTGKQLQVTDYTYEDMYKIIEKIHIIKKYMATLMDSGLSEEELDVGGEYYEELKKNYKVKVNYKVWDEITLGELTIN